MLTLGLQFAEQLPGPVREELQQLIASLQTAWGSLQRAEMTTSFTAVQPRCRIWRSAAQSITNNLDTAITWPALGSEFAADAFLSSTIYYDNGAAFERGEKFLKAADTAYFYPPVGGIYLIIAAVGFAANATGRREVWIEQREEPADLSVVIAQQGAFATPSGAHTLQVSAIANVLNPGGVKGSTRTSSFRLMCYQNSGGALNTAADFAATYFSMVKLS